MTTTSTWWTGRRSAGTVLAAAVIAILPACSTGSGTTGSGTAGTIAGVPVSSSRPAQPSDSSGPRVVLRFGDHAVASTLSDTAAARRLAAMLPMTLELDDVWGQAKSARLAQPIPVQGAVRTLKPTPGGIYYWPDTAALAVYYDDLGQSVPPPGLVRLGGVDSGLDEIADAGPQVTVRIDRAS